MHRAGLLRTVFPQAFAVDWSFQERAKTGPGDATLQALERFWNNPELAHVAPGPLLPYGDWDTIIASYERLSNPASQPERLNWWTPMPQSSEQPWLEVARLAEQLAEEDPIAGTLAALYAVAAWEGGLGDQLYDQPWTGHHWGWHVFPLTLGRTLYAADALWTSRSVIDLAMGFIEAAKGFPVNDVLSAVVAEYSAVADLVDRRLSSCTADLAWDLHRSLAADGANFRPEVAAMLWTLGDVPHAERVAADSRYLPTLSLIGDVVELSMSRLATDPFLQYLWLELKDRPPIDLRSHRVPFTAINNVYHVTGVHEIEDFGLFSPSRAYARTAIAQFAGSATSELAGEFEESGALFRELVGTREPLELLRLQALQTLTLTTDEPTRRERWSQLAAFATEILDRTVHRGVFRALNNCLDIPFHYLEAGAGEGPGAPLDVLERYRCSGLAYWLTITTPRVPSEEAFAALADQERDLLMELRGARFIRLLPHLPAHYRRHGFEIGQALDRPVPEGATELEDERGLLRFDPFDQALATKELDDAWQRLESLWEQMRDISPEYAAERLEPFATQDEFQQALRP